MASVHFPHLTLGCLNLNRASTVGQSRVLCKPSSPHGYNSGGPSCLHRRGQP